MTDASKIKEFFNGEVSTSAQTLNKFSRDASIFTVRPNMVVYPKNTDDLKALVKYVAKARSEGRNLSVSARSAGTDMTGGSLTASIMVEMTKYFDKIISVGSNFAVTQPGVYYRYFEKETLKHNLLLPSYPASRELCTVGGMVANNSGGEKTLAYGKTEKYVEQIKMVLADGNEHSFGPLTISELNTKKKEDSFEGKIYQATYDLINNNYDLLKSAKPKVSKNSAGYYLWNVFDRERGIFDLTKLIVGSQGTFGIITEVKLGLIHPKKHSRLLVIFLNDLKPLAIIANHILKFKPESFESYDDNTFKVAVKLFSELVKQLKGNLLSLAFSFLPEFWMFLTGGIPKLVLLAEFTGDDEGEVVKRTLEARQSLTEPHLAQFKIKSKVTKSDREAEKYWVIRRESFNLLRHHVKGLHTAPFIDDFVIRPETLPEFLPKLNEILNGYKIIYTIAGHVGDGNFHIIPLMKLSDPGTKEIIQELSAKVYDLVLKFGGSITGEHNDGLIRGPYLELMYGAKVTALFAETKKIFDPQGIFNPGKKTGASLKYALDHISQI